MTTLSSRSTRIRAFAVVAAALVSLTSIGGMRAQAAQGSKPPQPVAIDIDNFKFGVVSMDVPVGTTVTWTNRDDVPHTVASTTKVFRSKPLDTGEAFSYTFKDAGTFEYYCSMHPRMTGKIVVK
jgi:plastocyanin